MGHQINLLAKFVIYLQPTLAVTFWPVPKAKFMHLFNAQQQ
jgi:hypothetical protein